MDRMPRRKWTEEDERLLSRLKELVAEAELIRDSSIREDSGEPGTGAETSADTV